MILIHSCDGAIYSLLVVLKDMVLFKAGGWAKGWRRGASLAKEVTAVSLLVAVAADNTFQGMLSLV